MPPAIQRPLPPDALARLGSVKGFRVRPTAWFAVLNVGAVVTACENVFTLDIQILTLGESHDPSHTGIFGYSAEDTDVAALLAASVTPDEVHSAAS